MDFSDFDIVKAEKASAMRSYNQLPNLTRLFRVIEFCLALLCLSWASTRVPFAVRISREVFRRVAGIVSNPLFVFMLCNAIVATLFVKSKRFCGENPAASNAETELYEEFIKNSEHRCPKSLSENPPSHTTLSLSLGTDDTLYQDKEIISLVNVVTNTCVEERNNDFDDRGLSSGSESDLSSDSDHPKVYRRSMSDNGKTKNSEKVKHKLRRLETEKCRKMVTSADEKQCPEDELSEEEFQRAVDDFIARHLMFRRQESLAIVLQKE
ncbi:hypothetical protein K2173_021431 [Erythroxylum novogranatense]|uniref:DUF4408 domain-containing protein n=1 Tax=Erythroxylum novogranatense TaxID=1862640 RepID=A0AAV8TXM7_9ROSI|nr:hypothetical protein K2173_021431 [Erythroxylum novogranatense]